MKSGQLFQKGIRSAWSSFSDREATEVELKSYLQTMDVKGEADPLERWRLY